MSVLDPIQAPYRCVTLGEKGGLPRGQDSERAGSEVKVHFLLQGIFPTQGSNPGLLYCRQVLYCPRHQGKSWKGSYKPRPSSSRSQTGKRASPDLYVGTLAAMLSISFQSLCLAQFYQVQIWFCLKYSSNLVLCTFISWHLPPRLLSKFRVTLKDSHKFLQFSVGTAF